jgi:hypothetical protein
LTSSDNYPDLKNPGAMALTGGVLMAYLCTRSFFMGPTGFDSSKVGEVSMPGVGKTIRNQSFRTTTGEEHFALAA